MSNLSKKSEQTYSRIFPMDNTHPFKIVAPKFNPIPMRFATKQEATEVFNSLECQAIFTHNKVHGDTCISKIIGYKPGSFKY